MNNDDYNRKMPVDSTTQQPNEWKAIMAHQQELGNAVETMHKQLKHNTYSEMEKAYL